MDYLIPGQIGESTRREVGVRPAAEIQIMGCEGGPVGLCWE